MRVQTALSVCLSAYRKLKGSVAALLWGAGSTFGAHGQLCTWCSAAASTQLGKVFKDSIKLFPFSKSEAGSWAWDDQNIALCGTVLNSI